jgi:hypothetical protein
MRLIGLAVVLGLNLTLAPFAAQAQQIGVQRLCVLAADSLSSPWASRYNAFKQGLSDLGYVDGRNITINFLSVDGQYGRFPALAAECVRLRPDVIVAYTTPGAWPPSRQPRQSRSSWGRSRIPLVPESSRASRDLGETLQARRSWRPGSVVSVSSS